MRQEKSLLIRINTHTYMNELNNVRITRYDNFCAITSMCPASTNFSSADERVATLRFGCSVRSHSA